MPPTALAALVAGPPPAPELEPEPASPLVPTHHRNFTETFGFKIHVKAGDNDKDFRANLVLTLQSASATFGGQMIGINGLREDVNKLMETVNRIDSGVYKLTVQVKGIDGRLADLDLSVVELTKVTTDLKTRLTDLEIGQADLQEKVEAKFKEIDEKIDDKFDELDQKIDDRFSELDKKIDDRFSELDKKIDDKFGELSDQFKELKAMLSTHLSGAPAAQATHPSSGRDVLRTEVPSLAPPSPHRSTPPFPEERVQREAHPSKMTRKYRSLSSIKSFFRKS